MIPNNNATILSIYVPSLMSIIYMNNHREVAWISIIISGDKEPVILKGIHKCKWVILTTSSYLSNYRGKQQMKLLFVLCIQCGASILIGRHLVNKSCWMRWDSLLFNLAWSLLFMGRVPFSGHNLHTRAWGDMKMKGQPNQDSNPLPPSQ